MSGPGHIQEKLEDIQRFCNRYGVLTLWVFGSSVGDKWDESPSDFDLAVRFGPAPAEVGAFDRYFYFQKEISSILGRKVDLSK